MGLSCTFPITDFTSNNAAHALLSELFWSPDDCFFCVDLENPCGRSWQPTCPGPPLSCSSSKSFALCEYFPFDLSFLHDKPPHGWRLSILMVLGLMMRDFPHPLFHGPLPLKLFPFPSFPRVVIRCPCRDERFALGYCLLCSLLISLWNVSLLAL